MKTRALLVFAIGLLWSLSASSQILKPVKWSYSAKKTSASEATVFIKATLQTGWHVYAQGAPAGGPAKMTFAFVPSDAFNLEGKVQEPAPVIKFEKTFDMNVSYFEKEVTFEQKIKLKGKKAVVKGTVEFMACSDRQCLPPAVTEFLIPVH